MFELEVQVSRDHSNVLCTSKLFLKAFRVRVSRKRCAYFALLSREIRDFLNHVRTRAHFPDFFSSRFQIADVSCVAIFFLYIQVGSYNITNCLRRDLSFDE